MKPRRGGRLGGGEKWRERGGVAGGEGGRAGENATLRRALGRAAARPPWRPALGAAARHDAGGGRGRGAPDVGNSGGAMLLPETSALPRAD